MLKYDIGRAPSSGSNTETKNSLIDLRFGKYVKGNDVDNGLVVID
jgi:hypothetical protein